ncbi:MAG: PIN domain-containing protein [Tepidisphaeraceae bacterium]|jgi:predicted nucleic acid-binding protein
MSDIVLVDTNVLLDVLLARRPFVEPAQRLWSLAERRQIKGAVSAISFLNVYYVVRRLASRPQADRAVRGMRAIFQVIAVDREILDQAIDTRFPDFEDAVQNACALRAGAVCIVTRNERHFARSAIPAIAPDAFLAKIESE